MKNLDIIQERLFFVKKLIQAKESFRGPEFQTLIEPNGWDHPLYKQYSALRYYLLLTCFDILGQTKDFVDFYSWLNSSKHKFERDKIIENIKSIEQVEILKEVHIEYNKIYGMSNSFRRFINEILSIENRAKLLDSISVIKRRNSDNKQIEFSPSETMKINLLFDIRNSFTHKGKSLSSGAGGIFNPDDEDAPRTFFDDPTPMYACIRVHKVIKNEFYYEYRVRRWPSLLIEIIEETNNNRA